MKTLTLPQGRISYREAGSGPVLVLLHGALTNSGIWRKVMGPLSRHYRCIAPDLPLGAHSAPMADDADLSPPGMAQLIEDFLAALDLRDVTVLGNDTGGAYAQIHAARHPGRLRRLVLSNCDALEVFPPAHFAGLQRAISVPGYLGVMAALFRIRPLLKSSLVLGLLSHRLTGGEIFDLYMRHFTGSAGVRRDFRKVALGWSAAHTLHAADILRGSDMPVLLLWGQDDEVLFPWSLAERLAAVFPRAELTGVPGALTYVQEDAPEAFVEAVVTFMGREKSAA